MSRGLDLLFIGVGLGSGFPTLLFPPRLVGCSGLSACLPSPQLPPCIMLGGPQGCGVRRDAKGDEGQGAFQAPLVMHSLTLEPLRCGLQGRRGSIAPPPPPVLGAPAPLWQAPEALL